MANGWREWLEDLSEPELDKKVWIYRAFCPIEPQCSPPNEDKFRAPRWKMVLHAINHSTLHRGQVMGMLRTLGKQPPGLKPIDCKSVYLRRSGMAPITRRSFLKMALAISATAAWGDLSPSVSRVVWRERRELFPQGVASGDPDSSSVLLWTHCPQPVRTAEVKLNLEVAEDERFQRVIASTA